MKKLITFVLGASTMLVACGGGSGNLCNRASKLDLNKKLGTCTSNAPIPGVDENTCNTNLKNCTAADQQVLTKALDCLDAAPTCVKGQEQAWVTQVTGCFNFNGVSTACAAAINQ